ncbi:MAG: ferrous iron transport protein A [Cystobacterineae bacterium]|nr:ferrous iron transport protein A [Cystobacterineae bacterium]
MTTALPHVECPFCGKRFAPGAAQSACGPCGGCGVLGALKPSCALACPRCGYSVFASGTAEGGHPGAAPGNTFAPPGKSWAPVAEGTNPAALSSLSLQQCPSGQRVRVVALEADESSLRKLLTLGILPGVELEVERRRPCFLCKIGRARLAFDEKLAECVQVVPTQADQTASTLT